MTFQFQNTTPPQKKLEFRQILALCDFSVSEYHPPPKKNWNLGRSWHFVTFQFQNTPPPQNWNLGRSSHFVTFQFQNTTPPENWNLGRSWHFVTFQFQNTPLPPRKLEFRQIFALCDFSVSEYHPPPPWKLEFRQILALCDFSVSEYPLPPKIEICLASYHMWRLYPTRITTRWYFEWSSSMKSKCDRGCVDRLLLNEYVRLMQGILYLFLLLTN